MGKITQKTNVGQLGIITYTFNFSGSLSHQRRKERDMQKMLTAAPLTEREEQIMHLLARFYTYQQICTKLDNISYRTLNRHIDNIMSKTGLNRKELLIKYALEHGYGREEILA